MAGQRFNSSVQRNTSSYQLFTTLEQHGVLNTLAEKSVAMEKIFERSRRVYSVTEI